MRKAVLVTAILMVIFLVEPITQFEAVVVKANPYFLWRTIPAPSDAIPPSVTMITPQNNTLYYSAEMAFNFNIAPPKWTSRYGGYGLVDSLRCTLDNNVIDTSNFKNNYTINSEQGYDVAFTLHSLPAGIHTLQISADGVYLINSDNESVSIRTKFWISSSSTIYFTIDTTKEQTLDSATLTTIVAIALGILAAVSVLAVVTYRKRKATKQAVFLA